MSADLVGVSSAESLALFKVNDAGVILDTLSLDVISTGPIVELTDNRQWTPVSETHPYPASWREIARAAVISLDIANLATETKRTFKVPKRVKEIAAEALTASGGEMLSRSTAERLAASETVGIEKIKQIARHFSSTENNKTDWELYGGEAGKAWASRIIRQHVGELTMDGNEDTVSVDPSQPHENVSDADGLCVLCGRMETSTLHTLVAAADYGGADLGDEADPFDIPPTDGGADTGDSSITPGTDVTAPFAVSDTDIYFGEGPHAQDDSPVCRNLYKLVGDNSWFFWVNGTWLPVPSPNPDEAELVELDPDTAMFLAQALCASDSGGGDAGYGDAGAGAGAGADSDPYGYNPHSYEGVALAYANPLEAALFANAEAGLDWELYARFAPTPSDGYTPEERSANAEKQGRAPGGKFGQGTGAPADPAAAPDPNADTGPAPTPGQKARLDAPPTLVPDVTARIAEYLDQVQQQRAGAQPDASPAPPAPTTPPGPPVTAAATAPTPDPVAPAPDIPVDPALAPETPGPGADVSAPDPDTSDVAPLYLAIVDAVDTQAVTDLVALVPTAASTDGTPPSPTAYTRQGGTWVADPNMLANLQGATPPPCVELDPNTLTAVQQQVDSNDSVSSDGQPVTASAAELAGFSKEVREKDAKRGYALPDGSYPIKDVGDLKNAIQAYGRAKDKTATRKHIQKRARALKRPDLIPDSFNIEEPTLDEFGLEQINPLWGPSGEVLVAGGTPGINDTPGDEKATRRLKDYWAHGEGAAKIRWGQPKDFYRCRRELAKYVGPKVIDGLCANLHHEALGVWPGQEDGGRGHKGSH